MISFEFLEFPTGNLAGGTVPEHGTSVPIKRTVISGLKFRAPVATNTNLLRRGGLLPKCWRYFHSLQNLWHRADVLPHVSQSLSINLDKWEFGDQFASAGERNL